MMKKSIITVCFLILSNILLAQSNDTIISYFRSKKVINVDYYLFTCPELVQLCTDTIERVKFINNISREWKIAKAGGDNYLKEKRILFSLIASNINSININNKPEEKSKKFITEVLRPYSINFEVTEEFVRERFSSDKDLSICTSCKSMVIFLAYNPILFAKVRNKESGYFEGNIHFPIAYTLQDCNTPIVFTRRMKIALLNLLNTFKDPTLIKVYNEIKLADINNRCD